MKLELQSEGKTKIFVAPFVSGMQFRQLLKFDEEIDYSNMTSEDYDKIVSFICDVFGKQFTVNEFFEGVPSFAVTDTMIDVFGYVRTGKDNKNRVPKESEEDDTGNEQGKQ